MSDCVTGPIHCEYSLMGCSSCVIGLLNKLVSRVEKEYKKICDYLWLSFLSI